LVVSGPLRKQAKLTQSRITQLHKHAQVSILGRALNRMNCALARSSFSLLQAVIQPPRTGVGEIQMSKSNIKALSAAQAHLLVANLNISWTDQTFNAFKRPNRNRIVWADQTYTFNPFGVTTVDGGEVSNG
jgi:hypothetical protein